MRCAVAGCLSDNQTKSGDKSVRFHAFPKDNIIKKLWVIACCRKDHFNTQNSRICSKHFKTEDYERNLQHELLQYESKKGPKLKHDVAPSCHLPKSKGLSVNQVKRQERLSKRESKKFVKEIIAQSSAHQGIIDHTTAGPSTESCEKARTKLPEASIKSVGTSTDMEPSQDKELQRLHEENKALVQQLNELTKIKSAVGKIFTARQLKKLQRPKIRIVWTTEEVSQGIAIHAAGPRAYKLLLKKGYPYPAVSTLRSWAKKLKITPGIIKPVITILKKAELTDFEKICVLSFDEMKIRKAYAYDKSNDHLLKPANYVQVAMMRGLLTSWKQPIFFDYDRKMEKHILLKILSEIEEAGFYICALVSDLGGGNRGLHKSLEINYEKPWFMGPTNHKIHVFCDVPHLIKLIRNNFLDSGFHLNGVEIDKNIIGKLLEITSKSELRITFNINKEMLNVTKEQRQKVKYAAKLFSNNIAQAINRCGTLGYFKDENWIECATFFKLVNDWFDCLNVRVPYPDSRDRVQGYGLNLDVQNKIINEMSQAMQVMRVKGKKSLMPFQKGIIQTNNALKNLFEDMTKKLHIKYILTYNLNQDVLENCFGNMPACGLFDHPDAVEFRYRLKNYILGRNEGSLSEAGNTKADEVQDGPIENLGEVLLSKTYFSDLSGKAETIEVNTDTEELSQLEYDALEYVSGYICKKLDLPVATDNSSFTWIDQVSEGGLKKPPEELVAKVHQLDIIFTNFNGPELKLKPGKNYLKTLIELAKSVDFDYKIKHLFFRSRMYFRMKQINIAFKEQIRNKRKIKKIVS